MPTVISVRMHYSNQDLMFDPAGTGASTGDYVVVTTERGTEFGLVTEDARDIARSQVKGDLKKVLRIATDDDVARAEELADKGDEAMPIFREFIKRHELDMKPVGIEFLFGGEKAVFYFAAEERIDFRELVRDLASEFKCRVDMRQIGVRDEARLVGGFAPCGQELCCVRLGGEFEPVSIRMAKEQDLPLNSAKVSGVCGRLMCCLRYEFEAYKDFKQRAPKKNAVIDTPLGKAKIIEYNTPRELLTMRLENGKTFTVALKDMTCSESACKKAEEQRCPLRPDTVTREALEALGTAEIILQLSELDRANNPDGYLLDSSLISEERKQPRRRAKSPSDTSATDESTKPRNRNKQVVATDNNSQPTQQRRRRTRSQSDADAIQNTTQRKTRRQHTEDAPANEQETRTTRRHTRRHHSASQDAQANGAAEKRDAQQNPKQTSARTNARNKDASTEQRSAPKRTHRKPSGKSPAEQQPKRAQGKEVSQGAPDATNTDAPRRRRRRPGDKGGSTEDAR